MSVMSRYSTRLGLPPSCPPSRKGKKVMAGVKWWPWLQILVHVSTCTVEWTALQQIIGFWGYGSHHCLFSCSARIDQFNGFYSGYMLIHVACFEMKGKDEVFQLICLNVLSTVFVLVFRLDYIAVHVLCCTLMFSLRCRSWFWKSFSFVLSL